MLGLIWIQTVWHWWYSWKNFSKKSWFWKKSADDKKKHAKLPRRQRVKADSISEDLLRKSSIFQHFLSLYLLVSSADNILKTVSTKVRPDKNVRPNLDPKLSTLWWYSWNKFSKKKNQQMTQKYAKFPSRQRVKKTLLFPALFKPCETCDPDHSHGFTFIIHEICNHLTWGYKLVRMHLRLIKFNIVFFLVSSGQIKY